MIQKIIEKVSNLEGNYNEIVESEKILKILLTLMVVNKVFEMTPQEDGILVKQDVSVFMKYLNDQLDLYIEDKGVKIFLFSTIVMQYFIQSKDIMNDERFNILFSGIDGELFFDEIAIRMKSQLVESFRHTELFFKGVENEKV